MGLTEGQLGLTVRVKKDNLANEIPSNVRAAQRWLDNLPVADLGESASKVFHYIYDLNQAPIEPKARLHVMETVVQYANQIINSLSEIYVHSPLNSSKKLRSASELVHALASEQIFGFNTIIEDICAQPELLEKYQSTVLASACANALHGHGKVQLQRYELYKTIGSKVWREQNILYSLAKKHAFFNLKIKKSSAHLNSVKNQLLLNLTLATCNPYQMKHGQITDAYNALTKIAPLIELSSGISENSLYAYSSEQDIPPQPSNSVDIKNFKWHGLNLSDAFDAVESNQINQGDGLLGLFKKNTKIELNVELKRHILEHWNSIKSRNFIRINAKQKTKVAIGMAASHHFLVEKSGPELQDRYFGTPKKSTMFQSQDLQLESEDSQHSYVWQKDNNFNPGIVGGSNNSGGDDAFASIYMPRSLEAIRAEKENKPFKEIKIKKGYQWVDGLIRDVSPAGFRVSFDKAPSNYVESNELITVQNHKNGELQYNLGLIRWNRWHNDDLFLIGVELISPQATPVRATLDWDYAKPAYHHNGLLLPEMPNIGVDASVILPPLGYRSGQTVAILTPEHEYKVELTKKIIQTDNFIQFHYQTK